MIIEGLEEIWNDVRIIMLYECLKKMVFASGLLCLC